MRRDSTPRRAALSRPTAKSAASIAIANTRYTASAAPERVRQQRRVPAAPVGNEEVVRLIPHQAVGQLTWMICATAMRVTRTRFASRNTMNGVRLKAAPISVPAIESGMPFISAMKLC